MTIFVRMLEDVEKADALKFLCGAFKSGGSDKRIFIVDDKEFYSLPSTSFAYWTSANLRATFKNKPMFEAEGRIARQGTATADDFRFLRLTWELGRPLDSTNMGFAKGGKYSPYYADIYLWLRWKAEGNEIKNLFDKDTGALQSRPQNTEHFGRPGLAWPRRTKSRLSMRVLPKGCAFADKGPAVFVEKDSGGDLLFLQALCTSAAFHTLIDVQLAAADARPGGAAHSFEVGVIQKTPVPKIAHEQRSALSELARHAWSLRRTLDTCEETSHAFLLPAVLRTRLGGYDPSAIEAKLTNIQSKIDEIAFDLYEFTDQDRAAALRSNSSTVDDVINGPEDLDESEDGDNDTEIDQTDSQLSWAVGVAFGRFDWRLATGEREPPPEPDPFDPLPAKSPGMLPDGAAPFLSFPGILVDDQGHSHDLPLLIEEVLTRVQADVPGDVRRWLQRDFLPMHLKQYSKSRRKAPIYWPLSTPSSSYTLWLYYPSLTSQTLYTAVNDLVEPKLKQVSRDAAKLRDKGAARSREDEKAFEAFQTLELELIELRDTLLQVAPTYRPNHDDGVQITAAPLWPLFRHKPWQKLLKETWLELEKGEYDWAHLAMVYWPDRVREKCKTDKSLAIAHNLEHLYVPPEPKAPKSRARKKASEA